MRRIVSPKNPRNGAWAARKPLNTAVEGNRNFEVLHNGFKMRIGRKRSIWEPHNQAEIDGKHQKNALKLVPRQTFEVLSPNSFEAMEK